MGLVPATTALLALAFAPLLAPTEPVGIFGGTEAPACGWPNVVALGGICSGTLIHPRVVVYAAHCGGGSEVSFAENAIDGPMRTVATTYCTQFPREDGQLGRDFAMCVLAEPQLDVPIVPPLMGCERDQLTPGAEVVVVGFGLDEDGQGGIKRELRTTFHGIENEEAFIGGGGLDACSGDSGGPAFIKVPDPGGGPDSWRLFGIVSHGDPQCLEGTYYGLVPVGMEWFELESDYDLTPCTDADGTWNPGPRCTDFPRDDLADAEGQWPEGCSTGARTGPGQTCGDPFGFAPDDTAPSVAFVNPTESVQIDSDPQSGTAAYVIEVEASDPGGWGIDEVHLLIDGVLIEGGFDGQAPFDFPANFPPGTYELGAIAIDLAGNEAEAEPVLLAVDEELPLEEPEGTTTGEPQDREDEGCSCRAPKDAVGWWMWMIVLASASARRRSPNSRVLRD